MPTLSVHGAPSEYIFEEGILNELPAKLKERGYHKLLIVHGVKSWEAANPYFPELEDFEVKKVTYEGENSRSEIQRMAETLSKGTFDAVIGVGGGKVCDLVKAAGHESSVPYVLIPTLVSNCAPWTPISVIYNDAGEFSEFILYPESASLVLMEPNILIDAPLDLFIAGIGDTLAKWYEADVQMAEIENKSAALDISHYTAKKCKDNLLTYGEAAVEAVKAREINEAFIKTAETIIMLGGMVGGFGDHYGRVAGAHAIHNGMTALPETHDKLHGDKVSYGVLIQLVLEEKWEEIENILPLYENLNLPVSIRELGVADIERAAWALAEKACIPEESIHVLPGRITPEIVAEAILEYEAKQSKVLS